MYFPTEQSQRIPAGDFWAQSGAVWKFSTDTPGVKFGYAAIPGVGAQSADIPQADIDAIKIDDSSTVWTLSVPTPSVGGHDIVFGLATPSAAASSSSTAGADTTDAPTTTDAPPITSILDTNHQILGAPITTTATDATPAKRRQDRPFAVPLPQSVKAKCHPPIGAELRRAPQPDSGPVSPYLYGKSSLRRRAWSWSSASTYPRLGPLTIGLLPRAPRTRFYPIQHLEAPML